MVTQSQLEDALYRIVHALFRCLAEVLPESLHVKIWTRLSLSCFFVYLQGDFEVIMP